MSKATFTTYGGPLVILAIAVLLAIVDADGRENTDIQRGLYIAAIVIGLLGLVRAIYMKRNAKSVEHTVNSKGFMFRSITVVLLGLIAWLYW